MGRVKFGRLAGFLHTPNQDMVILIESGSTHNFLDKALWKLLKLPISTQDCFEVKVANGDVLGTKGACHEVQTRLQRTLF